MSYYSNKLYREVPNDYKFKRVFLPDDVFAQARPAFIHDCTDIIPVNLEERRLYLAPRISQPMAGWWWIGGRRFPGEAKNEAARRNFRRETKLDLPVERFQPVPWGSHDLICPGIHYFIHAFFVDVAPEEVQHASQNLDEKEYDRSKGLSAFNGEDLKRLNIHPSIEDLYQALFV